MHYRNGRKAKNGDLVIQLQLDEAKAVAVGYLQNAIAGNDFCNGQIIITGGLAYGPAVVVGACLCDCLHVDDFAEILTEKNLNKRPSNK